VTLTPLAVRYNIAYLSVVVWIVYFIPGLTGLVLDFATIAGIYMGYAARCVVGVVCAARCT
jgi:hypothetical protein